MNTNKKNLSNGTTYMNIDFKKYKYVNNLSTECSMKTMGGTKWIL